MKTDQTEAQLFQEQCERHMKRPVEDRMRFGFYRSYKPVLDDAPYRSFETMAEYREWCHNYLPPYLGYRIVGRENEPQP